MRKRTATIIGHRGVAGMELENTIASFKHAIALGVDAIEFDVHRTADGAFVVCHDAELSRISSSTAAIENLTLAELRAIELHNGEQVPLLREVLQLAAEHDMPMVVELKINHHLDDFCALLDEFPTAKMTIASFLHDAIEEVHRLRPELPVFLAEERHPFSIIRKVKELGGHGTDLNVYRLNPITYMMAKRANVTIMVYTVNNRALGRFVSFLYPDVQICTNYPKRFMKDDKPAKPFLTLTPAFATHLKKFFAKIKADVVDTDWE